MHRNTWFTACENRLGNSRWFEEFKFHLEFGVDKAIASQLFVLDFFKILNWLREIQSKLNAEYECGSSFSINSTHFSRTISIGTFVEFTLCFGFISVSTIAIYESGRSK
jgi:hypothetical protein